MAKMRWVDGQRLQDIALEIAFASVAKKWFKEMNERLYIRSPRSEVVREVHHGCGFGGNGRAFQPDG